MRDELGNCGLLFLCSCDTERGFDNPFWVIHAEFRLVATAVISDVARIGGEPTFGVAEADTENREMLIVGRAFLSVAALDLAPMVNVRIRKEHDRVHAFEGQLLADFGDFAVATS